MEGRKKNGGPKQKAVQTANYYLQRLKATGIANAEARQAMALAKKLGWREDWKKWLKASPQRRASQQQKRYQSQIIEDMDVEPPGWFNPSPAFAESRSPPRTHPPPAYPAAPPLPPLPPLHDIRENLSRTYPSVQWFEFPPRRTYISVPRASGYDSQYHQNIHRLYSTEPQPPQPPPDYQPRNVSRIFPQYVPDRDPFPHGGPPLVNHMPYVPLSPNAPFWFTDLDGSHTARAAGSPSNMSERFSMRR